MQDKETYHDIGFAVLDVVKHLASPLEEARTALLHLYEHESCSNCRETAVRHLANLGLPAWIIEECQFDSVAGTATLARAAIPVP